MRLHSTGLLRLRQNLQELIVGKEVESREGHTFGLQVVLQVLLDLIQVCVMVLERVQSCFITRRRLERVGLVVGLLHDELPALVHRLKRLGRTRELTDNIGRVENRLEVHPRTLACHPFVEGFLEMHKLRPPRVDEVANARHISRPEDSVNGHQ